MKLKSSSFLWISFVGWSMITGVVIGNIVYGIFNSKSQNDLDFGLLFPVLSVWFFVYCFALNEQNREKKRQRRKRDIFFVILILLVFNLVLAKCFWDLTDYGWYGCKPIDIWMEGGLLIEICICSCLLVIVLVYGIRAGIYLWNPLSISCAIVTMPWAEYVGDLRCLNGLGWFLLILGTGIIGLITEMIIMILLNRKKKRKRKPVKSEG